MQMSAKVNSATLQNFNYESNHNLKLSKSSNTATNFKQSNTNLYNLNNNNNNINSKENLLLSNCDSKLSAFTNRFRNTNKDYNNSEIKTNFYNSNDLNNNKTQENYTDSLQNSENGNMKILKSQLPHDLNDIYNKKFNLENFFNEVYYEKDLDSFFIIYIKDKIVNSIDYSKIFIINNKNFFILQIPFDNGKSQIFRVDNGSEISMQNYTIEITEDILKIIITLENNFGEDKKTMKVKKLHKLIMFKLFFKYFKTKTSNKIILNSAVAYNNNKLKRKIFNLLNLFYLIKIKENVSLLKIRKFVLRKNNFLEKVKSYRNKKNENKIMQQFMVVKLFFNLFRFKTKKLHETILLKNYQISMNTFHMKKFHENKVKENVYILLKKQVNKKNLANNNAQLADYLSIFLSKKKYFGKIRKNLNYTKEKLNFAFILYKKKLKLKLFKKLLLNRHSMKRFYYLSNKYNYFNYMFLFFLIQQYIKKFSYNNKTNVKNKNNKEIKIENNNREKDKVEFNLNINKNLNTINSNHNVNESFSTINAINKDGDSFICEINKNNSNLISDLNKSDIDLSKNTQNNEPKPNGFHKNCEFKININFKNYIYANYYNNNFHLPIVKNIFDILKAQIRKSNEIRFKFAEVLVAKKLKLNKELNFLKIKMTQLRLREHVKTQRRIFWNKLKIKLNQKKLQKIIKYKTKEKVFKFTLINNFINFISQINKRNKIKKYFDYKKKFISNKFLKFKFFQFLSLLYMKRKIEKKNTSDLPNDVNNYYNHDKISTQNNLNSMNSLPNYKNNVITKDHLTELEHRIPLLQSSSEKFEQHFISRLISPTNFIKDLKSRFLYFKRLLNVRLNYYKLIINCKREKIIKRKTQKFKDACLKIYSKFYKKIKVLMLYKRQEAFKKHTQLKAFYSKIIEKIKRKKRNYFIKIDLINNSKKISFSILKEYFLYKKSKARKDQYFKGKLNALYYKYNYESFFLKNAETLKIQKYFANKLRKNQISNVVKTLKKIAIIKKINQVSKSYLIKKHLQNSLMLIKHKNKKDHSAKIFNNRLKKFFFRYFLRNIRKLKIIKRIRNRKNEALKILKKNSAKFFLNYIFAKKAQRNLTSKNKEILLKKFFIWKLNSLFKKIQSNKTVFKKFFKRIFIKKSIDKLNNRKVELIKLEIIKKKYDKKLMHKFLLVKTIISKTLKLGAVLKDVFDRRKQVHFLVFLSFLSENNREMFAKQRMRKIRLKVFLSNLLELTALNLNKKKKLKKLKIKNYLKFFLNSILDKMLITQYKLKIKEKLVNYIQIKNFLVLKKNIQENKRLKKIKKTLNYIDNQKKQVFYSKFFTIVKGNRKCKKIKIGSITLFKRLLSDVFSKLQKNHFHCSQEKISKELQMKNINKSFSSFKKNLKYNCKKRFLKLKEETYKNKFEGKYNIKKFFKTIRKKISANINCKESLRNKITNIVKLDSQINLSAYNTNFQKYLKFNSIYNLLCIRTFLVRIKNQINIRKMSASLKFKNCKKFVLNLFKDITKKKTHKSNKWKKLKFLYNKYLFKSLYKILFDIKRERILITSFNQQFNNNDISDNNNENSLSASKLNNSILNISDSFKLKIYNFLQQIRKSVKIKKSFEKFYQFKIITEGKIFVRKLKMVNDNLRFKAHFENYFDIQNRLINYKFFLVRLQKAVLIKKDKEISQKRKVFEILKQNNENEKLIKVYLEEASYILY